MAISVNDSGTLRQLSTVHANQNGTLRELNTVYANENGTLRTIHQGIPPLSSVSISGPSSCNVGDTLYFSFSSSPSNAKIVKQSWSSSDSSSISLRGAIGTAKARYGSYIKVSLTDSYGNTKSSEKYVDVYIGLQSVSLSKTSVSAKRGETVRLTFTVSPSDANYSQPRTYFSSSNSSVIDSAQTNIYSKKIKTTAKVGDTATITLSVYPYVGKKVTASCTITVVG